MRFKDKVVLITGSSRGIGKATALAFAREGAKVVVNYTKEEKDAEATTQEIKKMGSEAIALKCDVSQEKQVEDMVSAAIDHFGRLDVLVNNAGIVLDIPLFEKTVEQWKRILEVNLIGVFLCSKYAAPHLRKTKGKIVNISTTNVFNSPAPEDADYDASKAGVVSLTKNLAKELAPDILVNSVAPGWVDTDINKDLPKDFIKGTYTDIYLNRW